MRGAITLPHSTSRLIFFFGRRKGRERERGEGRGGRLQRRRRLSTGKTKCIHIINSVLVVEVAATDQSTLFFFFWFSLYHLLCIFLRLVLASRMTHRGCRTLENKPTHLSSAAIAMQRPLPLRRAAAVDHRARTGPERSPHRHAKQCNATLRNATALSAAGGVRGPFAERGIRNHPDQTKAKHQQDRQERNKARTKERTNEEEEEGVCFSLYPVPTLHFSPLPL